MAEIIKRTFNIWAPYQINGLSRAAYNVADDHNVDCQIDREVIKTGWFSKRYEYHIRFTGEAVRVKNALDAMVIKTKAFADRVNCED